MDEINIPWDLEFIFHGILQHDGVDWSSNNCLCFRIQLIPEAVQLKDAISFAYGNRLIKAVMSDEHKAEGDINGRYRRY